METTTPIQDTTRWRVAYQGGPGSNSERAGLTLLAERFVGWPFASFAEATATLASGQADCVLIPVFNSTTGPIHEAIAAISPHDFVVLDTLTLAIEHYLLGNRDAARHSIVQVLAHPQVAAQCAGWIRRRGYTPVLVDDGALQAADLLQSGRRDIAILGPKGIGDATGLYCIEGPVQDRSDNRTTFRLLTRRELFEPRA